MSAPEEVLDRLTGPLEEYLNWQFTVGKEEATRQMGEACQAIMDRDGVYAVVQVVENIANLCARLEEFQPQEP